MCFLASACFCGGLIYASGEEDKFKRTQVWKKYLSLTSTAWQVLLAPLHFLSLPHGYFNWRLSKKVKLLKSFLSQSDSNSEHNRSEYLVGVYKLACRSWRHYLVFEMKVQSPPLCDCLFPLKNAFALWRMRACHDLWKGPCVGTADIKLECFRWWLDYMFFLTSS